jgi:hypothetical protein
MIFKTFEDLFQLGMARNVCIKHTSCDRLIKLNLGGGNKQIAGTTNLDLPGWDAECMPIPLQDESVGEIFAFHFFEHLNNTTAVLKECQRVLSTGGLINIVVPYYKSQMAYHDLTHKHFFTESTFSNLFDNSYYSSSEKKGWKLEIEFCMIVGVVERNLCLIVQLRKL